MERSALCSALHVRINLTSLLPLCSPGSQALPRQTPAAAHSHRAQLCSGQSRQVVGSSSWHPGLTREPRSAESWVRRELTRFCKLHSVPLTQQQTSRAPARPAQTLLSPAGLPEEQEHENIQLYLAPHRGLQSEIQLLAQDFTSPSEGNVCFEKIVA